MKYVSATHYTDIKTLAYTYIESIYICMHFNTSSTFPANFRRKFYNRIVARINRG